MNSFTEGRNSCKNVCCNYEDGELMNLIRTWMALMIDFVNHHKWQKKYEDI